MRRTLQFRFEELPLIVDDGVEAADVAGTAEIAYYRDGEWCIAAIALDGAKRLIHPPREIQAAAREGRALPRFARRDIPLDDGDPLFGRILHRLEHDWHDRVQAAVIEHLAAERDGAQDVRADRRRALRAAW